MENENFIACSSTSSSYVRLIYVMKVKDRMLILKYLTTLCRQVFRNLCWNSYSMGQLIPEQLWIHNICTNSLAISLPQLIQLPWIGSVVLEEKRSGRSCPLINPFVKIMTVSKQVQVFPLRFRLWKDTFWRKVFPFKMRYLSLRHSQGIHVLWKALVSNTRQHKTYLPFTI